MGSNEKIMKIVLLVIMAAAGFLLPIVTSIYWVRKQGGKVKPIFVGALTFFLFATVLEGLFHTAFLMTDHAFSRFLNAHFWAYALYGAFAAGIFEETGRLVAFKTLLRKHTDPRTSVSYGIGHGGWECMMVLGIVSTVMIAAELHAGTPQGESLLAALPAGSPTVFSVVLAVCERISAMVFHTSASVLVFAAARDKKKLWLYPLAILLHAAIDIFAALGQLGVITSILGIEFVVACGSAITAVLAVRVYKGMKKRD